MCPITKKTSVMIDFKNPEPMTVNRLCQAIQAEIGHSRFVLVVHQDDGEVSTVGGLPADQMLELLRHCAIESELKSAIEVPRATPN